MSEHTPGPWYANDLGQIWRKSTWDLYKIGDKVTEENPVATAHDGWDAKRLEFFSVQANARLIAAAPHLLHALKWLLNGCQSDTDTLNNAIDFARAAIAKAKGEAL